MKNDNKIKWRYKEPLKPNSIAYFEKKYNCTISDDLKDFVTENNGAIPDKKIFDAPRHGMSLACILSFNKNGIETVYMYTDPFVLKTIFRKTIKMIPFAKDTFGNLICYKNGIIVFWDHESDDEKEIAGSLNGFINMLHD